MNNEIVSKSAAATAVLLQSSLFFAVELDAKEAKQAVELYKKTRLFPYNGIPQNIAEIFSAIENGCGRTVYPGNNPNNGGHLHVKISIGNEYSFCVRVKVIAAYPLDIDKKVLPSNLESVGEKFKADENSVTVEPDGTVNARFWWD